MHQLFYIYLSDVAYLHPMSVSKLKLLQTQRRATTEGDLNVAK